MQYARRNTVDEIEIYYLSILKMVFSFYSLEYSRCVVVQWRLDICWIFNRTVQYFIRLFFIGNWRSPHNQWRSRGDWGHGQIFDFGPGWWKNLLRQTHNTWLCHIVPALLPWKNVSMRSSQGRIQGRVFGVPLIEIFFNLLGFFKKKIPKPPLNFPVHTKKFQNPSLQIFLGTPLDLISNERVYNAIFCLTSSINDSPIFFENNIVSLSKQRQICFVNSSFLLRLDYFRISLVFCSPFLNSFNETKINRSKSFVLAIKCPNVHLTWTIMASIHNKLKTT